MPPMQKKFKSRIPSAGRPQGSTAAPPLDPEKKKQMMLQKMKIQKVKKVGSGQGAKISGQALDDEQYKQVQRMSQQDQMMGQDGETSSKQMKLLHGT